MLDLSRPAYTAGSFATWWRRVVAALIDTAIGGPNTVLPWFIDTSTTHGLAHTGLVALQWITSVVAIVSQIVLEGRTGASIGKYAVGIRVLDVDSGRPIGMLRIFIRALMHILDTIPLGLGYLWPLWDRRNQTFADKVMGTVVIHQPVKIAPPAPAYNGGSTPDVGRAG